MSEVLLGVGSSLPIKASWGHGTSHSKSETQHVSLGVDKMSSRVHWPLALKQQPLDLLRQL